NARIRHLRGAETLLSMNFLAIHRLLEFNEYLGESAGEFQKIRIGRCGGFCKGFSTASLA
ncbi:hypothetical protein LR004_01230, partial [Candidatus Gracilibacteria bacterium]|nr:hypothetical protein [Candidatus Gracilibacteria bacterium]